MFWSSRKAPPNTACTRSSANYAGAMVVGRYAVRVFRQFAWLGVGSVKMALSRPTHQRVTPAVRRTKANSMSVFCS